VPARIRATLEQRCTQIEQWLNADDPLPIDHVRLVQRRLDIDAQLGQLEQAARLRAREAFVKVAASWCTRNEITAEALREVGVPARVLARAGL
jgi:hypothetical protein